MGWRVKRERGVLHRSSNAKFAQLYRVYYFSDATPHLLYCHRRFLPLAPLFSAHACPSMSGHLPILEKKKSGRIKGKKVGLKVCKCPDMLGHWDRRFRAWAIKPAPAMGAPDFQKRAGFLDDVAGFLDVAGFSSLGATVTDVAPGSSAMPS
jgi:hypothetical protein